MHAFDSHRQDTPLLPLDSTPQNETRVRVIQERIHTLSNSFRFKLILATLLLVIFYSVGNYLLIKTIVGPGHFALEQSIARKDMERCISTLDREIRFLDAFVTDWAAWHDTYAFINNRNKEYIDSNLPYSTFASNRINLIRYYDLKGDLVWGRTFDLETGSEIQLAAFPNTGLSKNHPLLNHTNEHSSISGILITDRGPMIIASRPIVTSEFEGPIAGTLVFGKLISDWLYKDMEEQIKAPFHFHVIDSEKAYDELPPEVADQLKDNTNYVYSVLDNSIEIYSPYPDYLGHDALVLNIESPRLITGNTDTILKYVILSNMGMGLLAMVLLLFFQKKMIGTVSKMFNISVLMSEIDPHNVEEGLSLIERNMIHLGKQFQYEFISGNSGHVLSRTDEDKSVMLWKMNVQLTKEIRERVKAEEALLEIQQHLEQRVTDRTKTLTATNIKLENEIQERKKYQQQMEKYQDQLRTLSLELLSTEERERTKIAEDLHDRIGQALSVTRMQIDALIEEVGESAVREQLDKIADTLTLILQDTRTMTFELSPTILYELGLEPALDWLAEQFAEQHGLQVDLDIEELPENTSRLCLTMLFRTIRELLINVVRHADTDRARVCTSLDEEVLNVLVSDQGAGFSPDSLDPDVRKGGSGFGLFSIQERVKNFGGSFTIQSAPGKGTNIIIRVALPCSRETERQGNN